MRGGKWVTIFCTRDSEEVLRLKYRLDAEGILYKMRVLGQTRGMLGVRTPAAVRPASESQEVLVREEDAERVREWIRNQ